MTIKHQLIIAFIIAMLIIYISEISNPCSAWVDTPCEYTGENNG